MKPATRKAIRQVHLYSGVFLAPAILFFAITGGLQMFSFHETTRGSSYKPPALLMSLAQIHKKGTYVLPQRKPGPPPAAASAAPGKLDPEASAAATPKSDAKPNPAPDAKPDARTGPRPDDARPKGPAGPNPLPFKIFAAAVAIGLVLSTLTGLVMSWMYTRRKLVIVACFIAGILLPIFLLAV